MGDAFFQISVETYDGHKGAERPTAFTWKGRRIRCEELLDRWYGEVHDYFKVRADDGVCSILRRDRAKDTWEIAAVPGSSTKEVP